MSDSSLPEHAGPEIHEIIERKLGECPLLQRALLRLYRAADSLPGQVRLMEVCGTHTHLIGRSGLRALLPDTIELRSGPGCPVCVTPVSYLDRAIALGLLPDVVLASFGDLLRVPSSRGTLEQARAKGLRIELVYSPQEALAVAAAHPETRVIFLAVGFETTAPLVAAMLLEARERNLEKVLILPGNKVMLPPMLQLARDPELGIDGFLLPGHVSVILGERGWRALAEQGRVPAVITGFSPVEIVEACTRLCLQLTAGSARVANAYRRAVQPDGNPVARRLMDRVFVACDAEWRGLGTLPGSGLALRPEWSHADAGRIAVALPPPVEPENCRCGDVLSGSCRPPDCSLFGKTCTPDHAVGACMVSGEGACSAWYRHERARGIHAGSN